MRRYPGAAGARAADETSGERAPVKSHFPGGRGAAGAGEIDAGGERAEHPGGKIDPELVERDGIRAAGPDDEDVFGGDEQPADGDEPFDARITALGGGAPDVDMFDERTALHFGRRRPAADELEQIGEHGGSGSAQRSQCGGKAKGRRGRSARPATGAWRRSGVIRGCQRSVRALKQRHEAQFDWNGRGVGGRSFSARRLCDAR